MPIPKYECEKCGERHDSEQGAQLCCPRSAYQVWLCGNEDCLEGYDTEAEAIACEAEHREVAA